MTSQTSRSNNSFWKTCAPVRGLHFYWLSRNMLCWFWPSEPCCWSTPQLVSSAVMSRCGSADTASVAPPPPLGWHICWGHLIANLRGLAVMSNCFSRHCPVLQIEDVSCCMLSPEEEDHLPLPPAAHTFISELPFYLFTYWTWDLLGLSDPQTSTRTFPLRGVCLTHSHHSLRSFGGLHLYHM